MGGGRNLLLLSVTPVAELAVITNSDTAKSWRSGARLQQAQCSCCPNHSSLRQHPAQSTQHQAIATVGGAWSSGAPRGGGDKKALPPESVPCPQPGTQALLSCWAYCWLPWKFLESSCWQLNCHGNAFTLPLQYSSKQSPLYLHSCPACNCKGPYCLPVNPACESKWSSVEHEQEELQADSLIRTCKFNFRSPRFVFFQPLIFLKPPFKTANTTALSSQNYMASESKHTSVYAHESKPESLDFYIRIWHLQRPAFHCKALEKPFF